MNSLPRGVLRQISQLNSLTSGPGAVKMPQHIAKLELRLEKYIGKHNFGAKQFWRQMLPPVQFYNPQLPISVSRSEKNNANELVVQFADGSSQSVNVHSKSANDIIAELIKTAKAEPIPDAEIVRLQ